MPSAGTSNFEHTLNWAVMLRQEGGGGRYWDIPLSHLILFYGHIYYIPIKILALFLRLCYTVNSVYKIEI